MAFGLIHYHIYNKAESREIMKKLFVFGVLGLLVFVVFSAFYREKERKPIEETIESTVVSKEQESTYQQNEIQEDKTQVADPEEMLVDFGTHFLNFHSLKERNQSVKEYMTEKCREENGINVDLNAEFQSVGKIEKVFQDIEDSQIYALLGYEDSRGMKNEVFFVIKLIKENGEFKIDSFRYEQLHIH